MLLGAEFVAAVQVIVYAGAVMVLFVFVIMLLNAGEEERTKGKPRGDSDGCARHARGGLLMAWVLLQQYAVDVADRRAARGSEDHRHLLFHEFLLPFEVTSVLILIAIMGAVVLADRPETQNAEPGRRADGSAFLLPAAERHPVFVCGCSAF